MSAQFFGKSIVKQASMYVVLPPGKGPFPVLYLLHGLSDDHTIRHRRTSIELYVEGRNLIVVIRQTLDFVLERLAGNLHRA